MFLTRRVPDGSEDLADGGAASPTDAELLRAHAGGDPHAFARLYDRHEGASFRFVRRMLGPAEAAAAEDAHQEVWVAVARNAGAFRPDKGGFRTWVYVIARGKVLDHMRRRGGALPAAGLESVLDEAADPGPTPLELVISRQLATRLVDAVEALPAEQREVFLLAADGELSLAEIAVVAGVPAETAKSRLRYARSRLRRVLADNGAAP
jgi:RNA polymerase sigma factor (sigma-70 family)